MSSDMVKHGQKPKQQRSMATLERIMEAALRVYSQKGFHGTNSKEIALEAGVAVGTFYNYFKDKKELFLTVMQRHIAEVMAIVELRQQSLEEQDRFNREGMREMIKAILAAHCLSPEFHREATAMELTDADVAAVSAEYHAKSMEQVGKWFHRNKSKLRVKDIDAAVAIVSLSMEQVVHTITLSHPPVDAERLISELADMLSRYLFNDSSKSFSINDSKMI